MSASFLAQVAKQVRAGRLELHSFCLMLNHFHMLVCSPQGQLSKAMANIQRQYSRWFNRTRGRAGPLVKDRFKSKPVRDMAYRCNVVTYIHDNPIMGLLKSKTRDVWTHLTAGLLRALARCTQYEIGLRGHRHNSSVCRDLQAHRARRGPLGTRPGYELHPDNFAA